MANADTRRALGMAAWSLAGLLCLSVLYADVSPAWTPDRAAFGNVRGFSRGLLNFVVLPAGQPFNAAPPWTVVLGAAVLVAAATRARFTRGTVLTVATGTAILAVVALSPLLSPYRIVLAPRSFALCLLLLCAGAAIDAANWLRARWTPRLSGVLAFVFFASLMLQVLGTFGGNYSGFVRISRTVAEEVPFLQERPDVARSLIVYDAGYDGQFAYFMAFDPLARRFADNPNLYRPFVDNPPYRYGRIGFSALIRLVSAGQPGRFPASMLWIVLAAHCALATLLASRAVRHGSPPFAALWYLAIPAFTPSLLAALPEALAAALIVGGVLGWETRRRGLAAVSFAAALLVRETAIVPLLAFTLAAGWRDWKNSGRVLGAAVTPVAAWRLFVAWRMFPAFGWASIAPNPGDFGMPFAGLGRLFAAGITHAQPQPEGAAAVAFPIVLTAAVALVALLLSVRRGPLEIAAAVYAMVAVSLNYSHIWSHVPSGERGTFELFLCLLLLFLERRERPAWIGRALTGFFGAALVYTFFLAPEAAASRAALLLIR